mmetsp:Transcript_41965/g.99518  ORF Transcript_41965/g.99518 Transcript_41965/m.99518 type:complete len:215 (+) Transcript_41965:1225-1869(+)
MFAKGPAWMKAGVRSSVCRSVGMMVSFISTISAPPTPRSSAVIGSPFLLLATTILPRRSRMSSTDVASARTAMISEATEMSNPVSRTCPRSVGAHPTCTSLRKRSLMSMTRRQVMVSGSMSSRAKRETSSSVSVSGSVLSMPSFLRRLSITGANLRLPCLSAGQRRRKRASSFWLFSWNMRESMAAARRLLAAVIAWMSPVRWRFISSIGITWL